MKFVCISDTHNLIPDLTNCEGDVIIHCGDCSLGGSEQEISKFLNWYASLSFKYKIIVPGNHDFWFEEKPCLELCRKLNIICLIETICYLPKSCGNIIKIWGSPITPKFHDWAFNKIRGDEIQKH